MQQQTERRERDTRSHLVELRKAPETADQGSKSKRQVRQKPGRDWQQRKRELQYMSIEDLREYLLDTEY